MERAIILYAVLGWNRVLYIKLLQCIGCGEQARVFRANFHLVVNFERKVIALNIHSREPILERIPCIVSIFVFPIFTKRRQRSRDFGQLSGSTFFRFFRYIEIWNFSFEKKSKIPNSNCAKRKLLLCYIHCIFQLLCSRILFVYYVPDVNICRKKFCIPTTESQIFLAKKIPLRTQFWLQVLVGIAGNRFSWTRFKESKQEYNFSEQQVQLQ